MRFCEDNIPGHFYLGKFGHNPNVGTEETDIWDGEGTYEYLDSGERVKVFSDSVDDDAEGVGLRSVQLYGTDNNYSLIDETLYLDGTNPVTTTKTFLRIFRAIGRSGGSEGKNIGNITVQSNDGTKTLALIKPNHGQTLMALWTVPAGMFLRMDQWYMAAYGGKDVMFHLYVRPFGEIFQLKRHIPIKDNPFSLNMMGFKVPEKSDIAIRVHSKQTGAEVSSGFDGWYKKA